MFWAEACQPLILLARRGFVFALQAHFKAIMPVDDYPVPQYECILTAVCQYVLLELLPFFGGKCWDYAFKLSVNPWKRIHSGSSPFVYLFLS